MESIKVKVKLFVCPQALNLDYYFCEILNKFYGDIFKFILFNVDLSFFLQREHSSFSRGTAAINLYMYTAVIHGF